MKIVEHIVKKNCMRIRMIPQKGFQPEHRDFFANYQHLTFTFSEPSWHHLSFV